MSNPSQPLKFGIEIECFLPKKYVESEQFTTRWLSPWGADQRCPGRLES